jgi:hypothetical protein
MSALKLVGALVAALLVGRTSLAAPVFSTLPSYPTPTNGVALRIDDSTLNGGARPGPHRFSISGGMIRVEGCNSTAAIPVGGPYSVTLALPQLAPGQYTVEYRRFVDYEDGMCSIPSPLLLEFRGSTTFQVSEPSSIWPPPTGSVESVYEYYHAGWDHYFITSIEEEKAAVELGVHPGWVRLGPTPFWDAGRGFGFFTGLGEGQVPVCRFFSAAFAPKSSHFYSSNPAECEAVKGNPDWIYEGVVGYVFPPNDDGSCARGKPLYRLYNNGRSGAPNHYYTDIEGSRDSRVVLGYTPEGVGKGVIACVPARP